MNYVPCKYPAHPTSCLFIQISLSVINLKVMEENVFKSLIRAMHVNMENLAADPIHEVHITNVPGGSGMHP